MPNGDTQMQYPFPYKNIGNDFSVSPNSTFNLFDCIDLIVQNTATIGGVLVCNAISSSGNLDALSANFQQTINAPNLTSITNFSNGSAATAELRFINNLSDYIRIGIGSSTSTYPSRGFIDTSNGTGLTIKNSLTNDTSIVNGSNELINFSSTGIEIKTTTKFTNLTPNTILSLDASNIVTSKNTTGTGDIVLNNAATFTGTCAFNTITCTNPLAISSGGTGLSTIGVSDTFLKSNGSSASWSFPPITGVTAGTNITITGGPNYTIAVSGIIAVANGGTGLNIIGTPNQYLAVNTGGTALEYKTPNFITDVNLTTPALFTVTETQLGSVLDIGLAYTPSQYLPVNQGGTGVGTSTGSGSVVLNNTPSLTSPNIDAATGSSLNLTVAGTTSTNPIISGQPLLAINNFTGIKLGVSTTQCLNLKYNNNSPANIGLGFNNLTDVVNITTSGIVSTSSNGGFAGNTTSLPAAGTIGEIFGDPIVGTGGTLYATKTTTNPTTTPSTMDSLTMPLGVFHFTFEGSTLITGTGLNLTFETTLGGTVVETIIVEGINNKYSYITIDGMIRITVANTVLGVMCTLSSGTASSSSWYISAFRMG